MMRLRQTRGEAGSHVVKLELCRTTVGFKDATIEGIGTLTFSVVSNAQRRIRNHLVHPVQLGTAAEYPARLAGALRLMVLNILEVWPAGESFRLGLRQPVPPRRPGKSGHFLNKVIKHSKI